MKSLSIKTPGKLYLSGEYAVVKGYHAIILSTKVTLDVKITSHTFYEISSEQWKKSIPFDLYGLHSVHTLWAYALKSAYAYLEFKQVLLITHAIHVQSGLDSETHKKWGLGSSGAFIVGLIEAVLAFHEVSYTPMLLYKLAVIAHEKIDVHASYGDIATAAYKSAILYKKFSSSHLKHNDMSLIDIPWEGLVITPIKVQQLPFMVINTGVEASSSMLVKHAFKHMDESMYTPIFEAIDAHTLKLYDILLKHLSLLNWIEEALTLYNKFPRIVIEEIINKPVLDVFELEVLKDIPKKFSGAGGGDNVICYVPKKSVYDLIKHALHHNHHILSHLIEGVKQYE